MDGTAAAVAFLSVAVATVSGAGMVWFWFRWSRTAGNYDQLVGQLNSAKNQIMQMEEEMNRLVRVSQKLQQKMADMKAQIQADKKKPRLGFHKDQPKKEE